VSRPDIAVVGGGLIDAEIGPPFHACQVMEWGFDAVLLNTAVSRALDPVRMAGAFAAAILAGHDAYREGRWLFSNSLFRARRRLVCLSRKVQILGDRIFSGNSTLGRVLSELPIFAPLSHGHYFVVNLRDGGTNPV